MVKRKKKQKKIIRPNRYRKNIWEYDKLDKLERQGFSAQTHKLIQSYLTNRRQKVRVKKAK